MTENKNIMTEKNNIMPENQDIMTENKTIMTENKNNWPTATPLASLQETPAVVDCPACNNRQMTTCEFVTGGRTQ